MFWFLMVVCFDFCDLVLLVFVVDCLFCCLVVGLVLDRFFCCWFCLIVLVCIACLVWWSVVLLLCWLVVDGAAWCICCVLSIL